MKRNKGNAQLFVGGWTFWPRKTWKSGEFQKIRMTEFEMNVTGSRSDVTLAGLYNATTPLSLNASSLQT